MLDEHGMPVQLSTKMIEIIKGHEPSRDIITTKRHKHLLDCEEIVRRLAKPGAVEIYVVVEQIASDAAKLWSKMQVEAKGGDGA